MKLDLKSLKVLSTIWYSARRKITHVSNQFEHLVPMHIVHCHNCVEGSIADGIVSVSDVNCYLL